MGEALLSTPPLTSAGSLPSPDSLKSLYCAGCKCHVCYLEVSNHGRVRSLKERARLRGMAFNDALVCSETCKIAAMQK
jgi:hypothetical protein